MLAKLLGHEPEESKNQNQKNQNEVEESDENLEDIR